MKLFYYILIILVSLGWLIQPVNVVRGNLTPPVDNNSSAAVVKDDFVKVSFATVKNIVTVTAPSGSVCQNDGGINLNQPASCFTWVNQARVAAAVKIVVTYAQAAARVAVLKTPSAVITPSLGQANPVLPVIPAVSMVIFTLAVMFELSKKAFASKDELLSGVFSGMPIKYFYPVILRC